MCTRLSWTVHTMHRPLNRMVPQLGRLQGMSNAKVGLAAAVGMVPVFGLVVLLALISGGASSAAATAGQGCVTSGSVSGLDDVQAQNARIVVATASGRAGPKAALIAVMTALAESGVKSLGNVNDPTSAGLLVQGWGHDHDSLGIFQQRPSWGSAAARLDATASTNLFMDALVSNHDWVTEDPWVAAQDVQRSAYVGVPSTSNGFSSVYGGNYLAQLPQASRIVKVIDADTATLSCGGGVGQPPTGPLGAYGLPVAYRIPAGTTAEARTAVLFALAQRGKPYVWAAAGPDSFDCSGLMHAVWAQAGVVVTHFTGIEAHEGTATSPGQLQPGDLILVPGADGNLASPGHVGMYIGEGLVVHAPKPGDAVRVVSYTSFTAGGVSTLRHIA